MGRRHRIDKARERGAPYRYQCPDLSRIGKGNQAARRTAAPRQDTAQDMAEDMAQDIAQDMTQDTTDLTDLQLMADKAQRSRLRRASQARDAGTVLDASQCAQGGRGEQRMLVNNANCAANLTGLTCGPADCG